MGSACSLFAARFDGRDFREIGREIVCGKCLDIHFDQADKRAIKVWFGLATSIKNHAYCANDPALRSNDVDRFLHAATAGHHIFDDYESFIR